jgi:YbbR domain-containing protein
MSLKLLSFFLAVALWFAVGGEERTETTLNLPLEIVNLNPGLMITSEVPSGLQVRLAGPRSIVRTLTQSRLVHSVDLASAKAGQHSIAFGPAAFSFPRGVSLIRVQPNPLVLNLAETAIRTLPIQPALIGTPPEGYEIKEIKLRPAYVTVKGPAGELKDLEVLSTLPIDISTLSAPTSLVTDLDVKNLHITLKDPGPILADLAVLEKPLSRTLSGVQVFATSQPARLTPHQVSVTLEGPYKRVKDLKPADLMATVDTAGLRPGRTRLPVRLQLPDRLRLLKVSPDTVTAQVLKSP